VHDTENVAQEDIGTMKNQQQMTAEAAAALETHVATREGAPSQGDNGGASTASECDPTPTAPPATPRKTTNWLIELSAKKSGLPPSAKVWCLVVFLNENLIADGISLQM
jgi:hypothetical protein